MVKVKVSLTLDAELLDKIDKKRGIASLSLFINNALEQLFMKKKVNKLIIEPLKKR